MTARGVTRPVAWAALAGAALWLGTCAATGRREAWDASAYWAVAYPAALLACALLGRAFPDRPWRWALVLFEAQCVTMGLRNGELGSLLELGVVMFAVIALPGIAVAVFAARRGGRDEDPAPTTST
jgi:hypothetical protein